MLVAAFDAARIAARIADLLPPGADVVTLDEAKLPPELVTNRARYLDKLNFATNFAFFRDADGLSTRLVSANYWAGYGGGAILLWLRLFDTAGNALATWQQEVPAGPCGFSIDSRSGARAFRPGGFHRPVVRACDRRGRPRRGQIRAGYLSRRRSHCGASLSCTHDANAWPSDRYAGLPAPREDERVILWLQNSHAAPIPAGAIALDRMGAEQPVALAQEVGPFATVAVDVARLLPDLRWPAQIELRAGRHVVRPRYEVTRGDRVRIAHVNVERSDLRPDPAIPGLPAQLGRGYLLPFPGAAARAVPQHRAADTDGGVADHAADPARCVRRSRTQGGGAVSRLPAARPRRRAGLRRRRRRLPDMQSWSTTFATAAKPMAGCMRCSATRTGSPATWRNPVSARTCSTRLMTYKDEPQSYSGPPPGLTTRLFLKLGDARRRSFAVLIYPASAPWHAQSATALLLHDGAGEVIAETARGDRVFGLDDGVAAHGIRRRGAAAGGRRTATCWCATPPAGCSVITA